MNAGDRVSIIENKLRAMADAERLAGMARYGINPENGLGVSMPQLRGMAKSIGHDAGLARALWKIGIHEMRILASLVHEAEKITAVEADSWAGEFYSWDVCDQVCLNLVWRTGFAWDKVKQWTADEREYVRRAGFSLAAVLAVHDKSAGNEKFETVLALTEQYSGDCRNMVKKAVNWALRQTGKRNMTLNARATAAAERILAGGTRSGFWIARDALRELTSPKILGRISKP